MAAGWTTINILDGGGTSRAIRAWDEGGPGPYSLTLGTVVNKVTASPTVTASTYAASVPVGNVTAVTSALSAAFSGILQSITLRFKGSVQTVGFWVFVFDNTTLAGTYSDHTAITWNAADLAHLFGAWHLTWATSALGTMTVYNLDDIGHVINNAANSSASLQVLVVPDNTTVALGSTSDFSVELGFIL